MSVHSIITTSPADIFRQAVQELYARLEPWGWKLLKNGDMKKKNGKLTYRISFFRSSKNYIDPARKSGSVTVEIYCNIETSREAVYRLFFTRPSPFQLLSKDCALDTGVVEWVWKVIEREYLAVINGLENDPKRQFLERGLMPIRYAPDYSYELHLKKELLEAFQLAELTERYEENRRIQGLPENQAVIWQESYYFWLKDRVDVDYCNALDAEKMIVLAEEAYRFLKRTERYDEQMEAQYRLVKTLPRMDRIKWVIAVFEFIYTEVVTWFEDDVRAKSIVPKIQEIYERLLPRHG